MNQPEQFATNCSTEPLTVKYLACELGVSEHYVYQAHSCGFSMERRTFPESNIAYLTATVEAAREWIELNNFHLTHEGGRGVTNGQLKFCLQTDLWTVGKSVVKTLKHQFAHKV